MKVVITGAAGRIAYSLIPIILHGHVFGPETTIDLVLLDIPDAAEKLRGIALEIDDCSYTLLNSLTVSTDGETAFEGAQVAVLLGGFPRLPGMERSDLLKKNAESIRSQAAALNRSADKNVKVVVVANPANTNCLVAIKAAPSIPASNFTCLTRLDEERLRGFCSKKLSSALGRTLAGGEIDNLFIFGNHSNTQVPYIGHGVHIDKNGREVRVADYFSEQEFGDTLKRVQNRGAEIIKALQVSSAMSAAEATAKHLRDWLGPQISRSAFSMGVLVTDNAYGITNDIVYSLPCVRSAESSGGYTVLPSLELAENVVSLMKASELELLEERREVEGYL